MAEAKKVSKRGIQRDALAAMAIIFATVAIWKGFSGIIDLIVLKNNSEVLGYFSCIVLGLVILATAHYSIRNFIRS